MLHNERRKRYSTAEVGNLENERSEGDTERERCLLSGEQQNDAHLLLNCTKKQRWSQELLNKWPNMNEEIALRKLLTGNKVSEPRNLDPLAYKMK
jgi:hypothetical protein